MQVRLYRSVYISLSDLTGGVNVGGNDAEIERTWEFCSLSMHCTSASIFLLFKNTLFWASLLLYLQINSTIKSKNEK